MDYWTPMVYPHSYRGVVGFMYMVRSLLIQTAGIIVIVSMIGVVCALLGWLAHWHHFQYQE